jgi:hypothetical protein
VDIDIRWPENGHQDEGEEANKQADWQRRKALSAPAMETIARNRSVCVAPFISLGVVYLGLGLSVPVLKIGDPNQPNLGLSSTAIVGLKLPIRLHGGKHQHNWARGLFGGG